MHVLSEMPVAKEMWQLLFLIRVQTSVYSADKLVMGQSLIVGKHGD